VELLQSRSHNQAAKLIVDLATATDRFDNLPFFVSFAHFVVKSLWSISLENNAILGTYISQPPH